MLVKKQKGLNYCCVSHGSVLRRRPAHSRLQAAVLVTRGGARLTRKLVSGKS